MTVSQSIFCKDCNHKLPEEWISSGAKYSCPQCGSTEQAIRMDILEDAKVEIHDNMRAKVKDDRFSSKKKIRKDIIVGDDLRKSDGKWMKKERVIDKDNDHYREIVTDPETGEVIHECEEKLSDHFGHGSGKQKKQ